MEPKNTSYVLAGIVYIFALILLGQAVRLLIEAGESNGYKRAIADMDEYQSRAIAQKLSKEIERENETPSITMTVEDVLQP